MFKRTAQKIKICAYIFFVTSVLRFMMSQVRFYRNFGAPAEMTDMLFRYALNIVVYFLVSLIIYEIGKIVGIYEKRLTDQDE